jgi:hypothetical protein
MATLSQLCPRCGSALVELRQEAPYIGPGERLVMLRDVPAALCRLCDYFELQLVEHRALDSVIRGGVEIMSERTPSVTFSHGRWRLLP